MTWRRSLMVLAVVTGSVLATPPARAQYDEPREYSAGEARFAAAGVVLRDFAPRSGNTAPDSLAIRFTSYMPMISYHQGTFELGIGYTRYTLNGATRSSVYVGTTLANELPVTAGREHALAMPICLSADFTKAEATGAERDNFNTASIGLGIGLRYRYMGRGTEGSVRVIALAHYSFEGLSTGNGSSTGILADAGLILRSVHIGDGIAIGYRFRYQQWSMSDTRFRYRAVHHGPYLGVLF